MGAVVHPVIAEREMTSEERKGSSLEQSAITIELYWRHLFPDFTVPANRYFVGWLRNADETTVIRQIEHVAHLVRVGKVRGWQHASRRISQYLKARREGDERTDLFTNYRRFP